MLSQDQGKSDQPITFESRKMSPAELNYPVHEKELLAIVHAIWLWRPYLEGQKFTVITDHASLEYIKTQHQLSRRQARWLETLQAHDFNVKYRPGKTNVVADALSRQPQLMAVTEFIAELIPRHELIKAYEQDVYFAPIYNTITLPEYANADGLEKAKHY